MDPRLWQIFFLSSILLVANVFEFFQTSFFEVFSCLVGACLTQLFFFKLYRVKRASYLSAVISSLSVLLLLRVQYWWLYPVVASIAIFSKFGIQVHKEHVFNPTNFAIVFALLFLPGVWLAPALMPVHLALVLLVLVLGVGVSFKVGRLDMAFYYMLFHVLFLSLRNLYLGDAPDVLLFHLSQASLFLFALFMITDPKTTPVLASHRLCHAALLALVAFVWDFYFYYNFGLIWALFICSPILLIWKKLSAGRAAFQWRRPKEISTI